MEAAKNELVIIGKHQVQPSDAGLLGSLQQRGYEVSFQDVPESQAATQQCQTAGNNAGSFKPQENRNVTTHNKRHTRRIRLL